MRTIAAVFVCVFGVVVSVLAHATPIEPRKLIEAEIGMRESDAAAYCDGISHTIVSLVAEGNRVAIDGLGAFCPAYTHGEKGDVVRTVRFEFDLGPALEQPGMKTVFDDGFIKALSSYAWLKFTGPVERRLQGEEWSKLVDIFVFCVLRGADGKSRVSLGSGLGEFYPTPQADLSEQRDDNERRVVLDFYADVDSPEKFEWQYELSVLLLSRGVEELTQAATNLKRYQRVTRITEYGDAATILTSVAAEWSEELASISQTKAQDHNSSRSNKTASIFYNSGGDLDDALELMEIAALQDFNSARSNKDKRMVRAVDDGAGWGAETLQQRAQDHNSSRSNKTASIAADFYNDLVGKYGDAYQTKAQDHNSSRSNKTASIIVDFEPGPELATALRGASF